MEERSILEKISSKYIFEEIFKYIEDKIFKMNLLCYSKALQKKININIIDYKVKYIEKLGINFNEYLTVYNYKSLYGKLNKDKLNKNFEKYRLDANSIKLYIIDIFKNVISQIKENINNDKDIKKDNNFEIIIDIYSPLFEILSKDDIFEKYFLFQFQ